MGIHNGTTDLTTKSPISYTDKGEVKETYSVVLQEPCMDHCKHSLKIKQMVMRVFMEVGRNRKEQDDVSGEEVKQLDEGHEDSAEELASVLETLMLTSETVDVSDFFEAFRAMVCMKARRPIIMLDGVQAMTDAIWQNVNPDDAYRMAIRWTAFFGMPSGDGQKTTSNKPSSSSGQPMAV